MPDRPLPQFDLSEPRGWEALGERWRELEARAAGSFFQSWSWVGTWAMAHCAAPVLLEGRLAGRVVALGLFNRRGRGLLPARLWLSQSGDPPLDSIYVEHNGLLVEQATQGELLAPAWRMLAGEVGHVVLSGIDDGQLAVVREVGGLVRRRALSSASAWLDLDAVRRTPGGHLALLSGNTRQQIRRSLRLYGDIGPVQVRRAGSLEEARQYLAELGALHQRSWTQRGQPGAFANPDFNSFHTALLATAWPRGEIDLLRIAAGAEVIGYLYNFRYRGRVSNYQSGFEYGREGGHFKPGLTCHHLAIAMYAADGLDAYDFLAGEHRYKTSLAGASAMLHWVEMMPARSLPGLLHRARAWATGKALY